MKRKTQQSGITLLITLLLMSVLLAISASLLNVTLKQFKLSSIAKDSEMAFQAAQSGLECAVFWDVQNLFDVDPNNVPVPEEDVVGCMGEVSADLESANDTVTSGERQLFRFQWGNPEVCTEVDVFKYSENSTVDGNADGPDMSDELGTVNPVYCPESDPASTPIECTIIKSRGYNTSCNNLSNPRTVEREITQRY